MPLDAELLIPLLSLAPVPMELLLWVPLLLFSDVPVDVDDPFPALLVVEVYDVAEFLVLSPTIAAPSLLSVTLLPPTPSVRL